MRDKIIILGNFDGVHNGHCKMLDFAVEIAKKENLESIVWSFKEHPENVLATCTVTPIITTNEQKIELILARGIERVELYDFNEVRGLTPEQFVDNILHIQYNASHVVCGHNYLFGLGGAGDVHLLQKLCKKQNMVVHICELETINGMVISSSKIRSLIAIGDMELAAKLLGRPYSISATVTHGREIGRTLGYPTINQIIDEKQCKPPNGVYVTKTIIDDKLYLSVTNVGIRPTVSGVLENFETHILDYSNDLYGKLITVEFITKIRSESKFASLDELKEQIKKDTLYARKFTEILKS